MSRRKPVGSLLATVAIMMLTLTTKVDGGSAVMVNGNTAGWAVLATADFDRSGRNDLVLGEVTDVRDAYRTIKVENENSRVLFNRTSGSFTQKIVVAQQTNPYPLLITGQLVGNVHYDFRAYMYDPDTERLEAVTWNGQQVVVAANVEVDPAEGTITLVWREGARMPYRLVGRQLERAGR